MGGEGNAGGHGGKVDERTFELTQNVMRTKHLLDHHFRSIRQRDAVFKSEKLKTLDTVMHIKNKLAKTAEAEKEEAEGHIAPRRDSAVVSPDGRASPERSRPASPSQTALRRTWSSPAMAGTGDSFSSTWHGQPTVAKGRGVPIHPLSVTRFCASTPVGLHPPPHPGSYSTRPHSMLSSSASQPQLGTALSTPQSPCRVSQSSWAESPARRRLMTMETSGTYMTVNSSFSLASPSELAHHSRKRPPDDGFDQGSDSDEEALYSRLDAECYYSAGLAGKDLSQVHPQRSIEKLGRMMAMLGPRYKTVDRVMLWEKATQPEMSMIQKRLQKQGSIRRASTLLKGPLPQAARDNFDLDPDGGVRAAWLAARDEEHARRSRMPNGADATEALLNDGDQAGGAGTAVPALGGRREGAGEAHRRAQLASSV
eukprot:gnl/TRDRNA2_/TRDRNA2_190192_c0_seq1.p1 gnl/TRDRNA2_/TRDRNA2_190192_c0~~gnl/TRDRNA2_/TRDRNA2_190192_c0_seq1.p1  ORF type:complete len:425 (-),score=68.08 gnl/TRDRNA2_/TRDRNA2_190192_c0_seq1:139-1413(-)